MLLFGCAAVGIGTWGLSQVWRTRDWVRVEGQVLRFEQADYEYTARHSGGGTSTEIGRRIQCWYRYEAEGQAYESSRYSELEPWDDYTNDAASLAQWRARVDALQTGQVPVWYDPDAPQEAVLLLPESAPPTALFAVGLCLLLAGGLLLWRRRSKRGA